MRKDKTLFSLASYSYFVLILALFSSCHLNKKTGQPTTPTPIPRPRPDTHTNTLQFTWSGKLNVTSRSKYRQLLQSNYICNQGSLFNLGDHNCKAWDDIADIHIQFVKTSLPAEATLTIQPYNIGTLTSIAQSGFKHIQIRGQAYPIQNSKGFRLIQGTSNPTQHPFSHHSSSLVDVTVESEFSSPKKDAILSVILYYGAPDRESSELGTAELVNKAMIQKNSHTFSYQR